MFVLISGYFTAGGPPVDSCWRFYRRRLLQILPSFLIYAILTHYYVSCDSTWARFDWGAFVCALANPRGVSGHFWFIYTIIGLYLSAPVLGHWFASLDEHGVRRSVLFLFAAHFVGLYQADILAFFNIRNEIVPFTRFDVWFVYFCLGALLPRLNGVGLRNCVVIAIVGYVLMCLSIYFNYGRGTCFVFKKCFDAGLGCVLCTVAIFAIFLRIQMRNIYGRWFGVLVKSTYGVYLAHIVVIVYLRRNGCLGAVLSIPYCGGFVAALVVFVITMTLVVLIEGYVVGRVWHRVTMSIASAKT